MSGKPDLLNLATDEQRDRIHDLIDALPTEYFGMHDGCVEMIKELYQLVTEIEQMSGIATKERDPLKFICDVCGKPATVSIYTDPTGNVTYQDFCDEHKPPMKAVLNWCFICNAPAKYKCSWYPNTTEGGTELMQEWVCQTHYDSLQQTESASLEIIEEVDNAYL